MNERHLLHDFFNRRPRRPAGRTASLINLALWVLIIGLLATLVLLLSGVL
jgi:hypothetical protein